MKQLINYTILLIVYNHQTLIAGFSLDDPVKFFSSSLNHNNGRKNTRGYGDPYPKPTTTTTTRAPTTQPAIPEDYFICPQKTGQFPHPCNHSQYYICQDYEPISRICPYLFLYDISTKRCEHEDIAKCVKVPHPLRSGDAFEGIDENYRCLHEGVYPHETECDKYYSCVHEVAYVYRCYAKLFDVRLNSCNFVELTDCGARKRPSDLPGTITPPPTTVPPTTPVYACPPNSQEQLYRDPYDCTAYYTCAYGTPQLLFCQDGVIGRRLHFDEERQRCDHPENVNCTALPIN